MAKHKKILKLEDLAKKIAELKKQGKTVAQCHGCFDLLHPGHIMHFQAAKKHADIVVVTITPDHYVNKGPGRPVFTEQIRMESIAAMEAVDYVALNKWPTAVETIKLLKPTYYVKGPDYKDRSKDLTKGILDEENAIKSVGGEIYITEEPAFSSSNLINSFFSPHTEKTKEFVEGFKKKHSFENVVADIEKMNNLKVMVIGDTIIDEYHYCNPLGKSSKSPTISTIFLRSETFAGGVLAIANHLEQLAGSVKLVTCLGKENTASGVIGKTLSKGVNAKFFTRNDGPTPVKRRYLDRYQNVKLFEVTFMNDQHINTELEKEVVQYLNKEIPNYDLVIITDFGHGFITPGIIKCIQDKANYVAINAQTNSNNFGYNYITKYHKSNYISIDEKELRLPFGDNYGNLETLIKKLHAITKAEKIQITLGGEGSLWYENKKFYRTPAFARVVKDSVGAGDAVLSVTALCAILDIKPEIASFIGNCTGALAVEIIGNAHPVYKKDLVRFIQYFLK
ncbi:MAG TPA: PfkB family carbohydrate kinase [Bacteroidia bacterium]|jgi:rfaE bifunctional protein kinase chain/domain/rfaE bifunctional protein nucleotidyltransferase chain/domain|nr:PfkB family carbohydrate kinase [Bacteroidia bacterium]